MAKRRRGVDVHGTTTKTVEYSTVFVDTSLDTHLAMLVSKSDTVSDFKEKMLSEHVQCFPKIKIHIQSLKVKRRAEFYHLPDNMHVWSAFHGVKGNWFLSVDASDTLCHLNQNSAELRISDSMKMDVRNADNSCRGLSSDINKMQTLPMSLPDGFTAKNVVSEVVSGFKVENSLETTTDIQNTTFPEKHCMETESPAKKKPKTGHREDACQNPSFDAMAEVSGVRNGQSFFDDRVAFEGTSVPAVEEQSNIGSAINCPNHIGSDEWKEATLLDNIIPEDLFVSLKEHDLGQDVRANHSRVISVKVPDLSAGSMDASGATRDVNSSGIKMKQVKAPATAANIQDTTDREQNLKGKNIMPVAETHKSEEKEEEKYFALNNDHAVRMLSSDIASYHANPDLPLKESPEITSHSKKKKKRAKKKAIANQEKSAPVQTDNAISWRSVLLCSSTGYIPEEADKEEIILFPNGDDVQLKLLNSSTLDAGENVPGANGNEADFVMSTQTKLTLKAVPDGEREMDKETHNSAGNGRACSPALEKENQILEFNQVEKDSENTMNMDKKAKRRRRKRKLTTLDVQEKDQNVVVGVLTTDENSTSLANSETEGIHVASSQLMSHKLEENVEEKHEIAVNADGLACNDEDEGEGINFKQYCVLAQYQGEVDSPGKVKKANQSNMEKITLKKVERNGLSSMSISTEDQSSRNLSVDQESENKIRVRKDTGQGQGDLAQDSDWDEVLPNSSRKSSGVWKNGLKDSSTYEMPETNLQKPKQVLAETSITNKKNASLKKSSSERSERTPRNRGNKRSQSGLNVSNRMEIKTPEKKSLLTKEGAIFHNSGENAGDENATEHSSRSTRSPSDNSSMSDYSVGENNLSQDSTRNGSSDAIERSAGGEGTSKLDLSAPENITMHMILRSSKRFKKAKLIASQNEADQNEIGPIELVPDSLPM